MASKIIKRKKLIKKIAAEQIDVLFKEAKQIFERDPKQSQRYIDIARAISKRCKVQIPKHYKIHICKHCKTYIVPGINSKVRIRSRKQRHLVITCLYCKKYCRYYY